MACTSGSVQKVADKTAAAKEQVDNLVRRMQADEEKIGRQFEQRIDVYLAQAGIKDQQRLNGNSEIKVEYTSEFSLDKIAGVVTASLKAAAAAMAKDPSNPAANPAMSKEAIDAYTDVVNCVAEAAKSKSSAAASLSFSMTRLAPGLFAFLYATAVNIKDEDTFGSEAVTSTSIFYRYVRSIDDVKNESKFGEAIIDARSLKNMKDIQAALIDDLSSGKIDIDTWTVKDAKYEAAVKTIRDRLNSRSFRANALLLAAADGFGQPVEYLFDKGSLLTQEVVRASIEKLSGMGAAYKEIVAVSSQRLAANYF